MSQQSIQNNSQEENVKVVSILPETKVVLNQPKQQSLNTSESSEVKSIHLKESKEEQPIQKNKSLKRKASNKEQEKKKKKKHYDDEDDDDDEVDDCYDEERSEDEESVGSLKDFVVDQEDEDITIQSHAVEEEEKPLKNIDVSNIIQGKRKRKPPKRYFDKDYLKIMSEGNKKEYQELLKYVKNTKKHYQNKQHDNEEVDSEEDEVDEDEKVDSEEVDDEEVDVEEVDVEEVDDEEVDEDDDEDEDDEEVDDEDDEDEDDEDEDDDDEDEDDEEVYSEEDEDDDEVDSEEEDDDEVDSEEEESKN